MAIDVKTKVCNRCRQEKPSEDYYRRKFSSGNYGLATYCKDCRLEMVRDYGDSSGYFREYYKEYEKRPGVRERKLAQSRGYGERPEDKFKNRVRTRTNHFIRNGTLQREPCVVCGVEPSVAHHLDYDKPDLILWLCPEHHRKIHRKQLAGETR